MSISADAKVFYGIILCGPEEDLEADGWEWDPSEDWEDICVKRAGGPMERPEGEWSDLPVQEYYNARNAILDDFGCDIRYFGMGDYLGKYVFVKGLSSIGADAWTPQAIDSWPEINRKKADQKLKRFCDHMGLKYSDPKWWLTCIYW